MGWATQVRHNGIDDGFSPVTQRRQAELLARAYLDALDAQRSLFVAQLATVQVQLSRLQNQVTLYKVLGGGWTEPAPN